MSETVSNDDAYLDGLLERLVTAEPIPSWDDVLDRASRPRRRRQRLAGVRRRRPLLLSLVAAAATVTALALAFSGKGTGHTQTAGQHHRVGREATISLAGYRFRLPAGYASSHVCEPATSTPGNPSTVIHSMRAAASATGGCIGAAILARSWTPPPDAQAVSVGSYDGFFVPGDPQEALFVRIPATGGDHYLVISAERLAAQQLIAIAESGLPSSLGPTQTCMAGCG